MGKTHSFIIVVLSLVFLPLTGFSQGMVYLSNLGESSGGSESLSTDLMFAQSFTTGSNAAGYYLNSVTLDTGSSTFSLPLTPTLYGNFVNTTTPSLPADYPNVGNALGTASQGTQLAPSTVYWILVTAKLNSQVGTPWYYANSENYMSQDGWKLGSDYLFWSLASPTTWTWNSSGNPPLQIAFNATAAPEPGVISICAIGIAALWARRKR